MPPIPSISERSDDPPADRDRRRFLAAAGTAATTALAGCVGSLPGTGPDEVDAELVTDRPDRVAWRYPPTEGDADGIGYASVDYDGLRDADAGSPTLPFVLSATVGDIAAGESHRGYRHDWFRFRLGPPAAYTQRRGFAYRVQPPGQWEGFAAYSDYRGGRRELVVELRGIETEGTIGVPVFLVPFDSDPLPERVACSFTLQVGRPGWFGRTVRVSDRGTLELAGEA
ncbi:hypothetical protein [Haloarcula litorea]|uniref:hypothetical protein n=1 Tax=Haloarcula litorea TaxID=3032579 RepID=UPI0023E8F24F|nr:hypothetical protein [Halomicroarcula sp. GDY20]